MGRCGSRAAHKGPGRPQLESIENMLSNATNNSLNKKPDCAHQHLFLYYASRCSPLIVTKSVSPVHSLRLDQSPGVSYLKQEEFMVDAEPTHQSSSSSQVIPGALKHAGCCPSIWNVTLETINSVCRRRIHRSRKV